MTELQDKQRRLFLAKGQIAGMRTLSHYLTDNSYLTKKIQRRMKWIHRILTDTLNMFDNEASWGGSKK